jgi:L-lactate dehydrogenase complex protein LldG
MNSRELILSKLKKENSGQIPPEIPLFDSGYLGNPVEKFKELIAILHGETIHVHSAEEIQAYIDSNYAGRRVLLQTSLLGLNNHKEWENSTPHELQDVEFALFEGRLGVAENGAVWFNTELLGERVAPYITQQMGILLRKERIVPTLAEAYDLLGSPDSGFAGFIAGPSKTADIEQSLVTGAHGARGLVVFLA